MQSTVRASESESTKIAGQEVDDGPKDENDDDHGIYMVNSKYGLSEDYN